MKTILTAAVLVILATSVKAGQLCKAGLSYRTQVDERILQAELGVSGAGISGRPREDSNAIHNVELRLLRERAAASSPAIFAQLVKTIRDRCTVGNTIILCSEDTIPVAMLCDLTKRPSPPGTPPSVPSAQNNRGPSSFSQASLAICGRQ
jgi:hypothetical protein